MGLVFSLYDFDNDGYIQREDVKILLSYIPLRKKNFESSAHNLCASSTSLSQDDDDGRKKNGSACKNASTSQIREGLYGYEDGRDLRVEERVEIQSKISSFTEIVFEGRTSIGLKDFIEFNTSVTSEMFVSVMSILHEKLPCSDYIFRQRKTFKQQEVNRNKTKI